MLRNDEADVLAVWKFDRWSRQGLSAVADLISTLDSRPGALFFALRDGLRSDQPAWRIIASVLAEVARMDAENTSMRVRSAHRGMKRDGRWPGGIVPFGYWPAPQPDGPGRILKPHPPEAAIVVNVAERILRGDSLTRIVKSLNDDGVPCGRSPYRLAEIAGRDPANLARGDWRLSSVRNVWTSEHLLGRLTDRGEVVRDERGLPLQAFEPILDLSTATQLRNRFTSRTTGERKQRTRAARLLSGVAYCAYCNGRMYVGTSGGRPSYRCPRAGRPGECPGVRVSAESLEEYVTERFLGVVGNFPETIIHEIVSDPATATELAEVESSIRETVQSMTSDDADTPELLRRLEGLKAHRKELRLEPMSVEYRALPTGRTLGEAWASTEATDERRRLLTGAIDHVRVSSAAARGNKFDPDRAEIIFES